MIRILSRKDPGGDSIRVLEATAGEWKKIGKAVEGMLVIAPDRILAAEQLIEQDDGNQILVRLEVP